MITTISSLLSILGLRVTTAGQTLLSTRSGQEPVIYNTITVAPDAATTLTAAQVLGGIIEAPITLARTYTLPTGAQLDAAIDLNTVDVGAPTFTVQVINTAGSAVSVTLAGNTGVTIKGNAVVPQSKVSYLMFLRTGTATWNVYTSVSA